MKDVDTRLRDRIVRLGESLFARGLTPGASGNLSARTGTGGWLMTPTGVSLGDLEAERLSALGADAGHQAGDKPTKESFLHLAVYEARPDCAAVVHLHSTHAVAVSCLADTRTTNALPPLTAYYAMRVGALPMLPYYPPGDINLAKAVREMSSKHHAVLLANHGPVIAGKTLEDAVYAAEELEETAKLYLLLHGMQTRPLTAEQIGDLRRRFPS